MRRPGETTVPGRSARERSKPKRFTLDFKSQGRTLGPTAATKKVLDEWGKEAPEFWWKIKQ